MLKFVVRNKYILLMLLASILSFIWTLSCAPIYDYADMTLPKRYFIIEALHNGILPLWNPYQSMGAPEHIDANIAYLPLYLVALFGKYNPIMWGIEEIFYGFVAGMGFLLLCKRFAKNTKAAFVMAVCYMNSGAFIANTQHFTWIIGLAWLPFVLHYFVCLLEKPSLKKAILTSIFASLLFTGAYPGFAFVLFSLAIIILAHFVIIHIKNKEKGYFKSLIRYLLVSGLLFILLSLAYIISIYQSTSLIARGAPLFYDQVSSVSLTWQSFISLFFPYIACSEGELIQTDISMGSIFIGVLSLFFAIIALRHVKGNLLKILLIWGLFCGLTAFGNLLPVHRIAFYVMPFFKFIRITSFFRLFFVLSLLLLAAVGFDRYIQQEGKTRKHFYYFLISCSLVYLSIFTYLVITQHNVLLSIYTLDIKHLLYGSIEGKFALFSLFHVLILLIALLIHRFAKRKINGLIILISCEMLICTWACMRHTGYSIDVSNRQIATMVRSLPSGYPVPTEVIPCSDITQQHNITHLWRNIGMLSKQVESESYNPFLLTKHQAMLKPYNDAQIVFSLPVVAFFPQQVVFSDTATFFNTDIAYTCDSKAVKSYANNDEPQVVIEVFEPGNIVLQTQNEEERPLIVCQNNYPGWKAKTEEGKDLKITSLNTSLISFQVPQGKHKITLSYHRPDIVILLLLAAFTWLLLAIYLLYNRLKGND